MTLLRCAACLAATIVADGRAARFLARQEESTVSTTLPASPIDIVLVQDLTSGFAEHLKALGRDQLHRLDSFIKETGGHTVRVGLVSFQDKPIWPNGNDGRFNGYSDFCAHFEAQPSAQWLDNLTKWYDSASSQGGGDPKENQFGALMVAAEGTHFADQSQRIVVLMTDSEPHFGGDGSLAIDLPPFSGSVDWHGDQCRTEDYPRHTEVVNALQKNGVHTVFFVTDDSGPDGRVTSSWRWFNAELRQPDAYVYHMDKGASYFFEYLSAFIDTLNGSDNGGVLDSTSTPVMISSPPTFETDGDTSFNDFSSGHLGDTEYITDTVHTRSETAVYETILTGDTAFPSDTTVMELDTTAMELDTTKMELNTTTTGVVATLPSLPITFPTLQSLPAQTYKTPELPMVSSEATCVGDCEGATALPSLSYCLKAGKAKVYLPGDPQYYVWNVPYNMEMKPGNPIAVVLPKKTSEVVKAVDCATRYNTTIIPRSGGHDYASYTDGTPQSIVIDLREMNGWRIDEDTGEAEIEAGIQTGVFWYKSLENSKMFLPMGACTTLGIGGHVLGGGYGFYTRQHGLAVDHITGFEVVLADGSVVTATREQEPELYWGLAGSGNGNFGVVTRLYAQLIDAPPLVTSYSFYWAATELKTILQAANEFTKIIDPKLSFSLTVTQVGIMLKGAFEGSLVELKLALLPFLEMVSPPLAFYDQGSMLRSVAELSIVDLLDAGDPVGVPKSLIPEIEDQLNDFLGSRTLVPEAALLQGRKVAAIRDLSSYKEPTKVYFRARSILYTDRHPFTNVTIDAMVEGVMNSNAVFGLALELLGGNGSVLRNRTISDNSFSHRDAVWVSHWYARSYLPLPQYTIDHANDLFSSLSGTSGSPVYVNYHDRALTDYLESYYASEVRHLKQIKAHYDPHNRFAFAQSVPPA